MKKKITLLLGCVAFGATLLSHTADVASTGAPIGSTGAPNEYTCARIGCHTGNDNVNTGQGILSLSIGQDNTGYIPGQTYNITVSLAEPDIERFGFSLTALNAQGQAAGTMHVTDDQRTQIMMGSNEFTGRDYVTYTAMGTNPYSVGLGQWTFEWTAPENGTGPVSFYVAGVSADNDGTDEGDLVYLDSTVLESNASSINEGVIIGGISLFPNPAEGSFTLSYKLNEASETEILAFGMDGTRYLLWKGQQSQGLQQLQLNTTTLASGVYYLGIQSGNQLITRKLLVP